MTPKESAGYALRKAYKIAQNDSWTDAAAVIEQAITAAVEEDRKTRPHVFVGSLDRWCEVCNEPDRDNRHIFSRETLRASVEVEREACAQIIHEVYKTWFDGDYSPSEAFDSAKEKIRARSNGGEK